MIIDPDCPSFYDPLSCPVFFVKGHLDDKEEEVLQHAVTNTEMMIAYHPNLEELPELSVVLEKIEFLHELSPEQRQR